MGAHPTTDLERQQREVIGYLMSRLGVADATSDEERISALKVEVEAAEAALAALEAECGALEKEQGVAELEVRRDELEEARAACERHLVTLPAKIVERRDATAALEVSLAELREAAASLDKEEQSLAEQQAALETALVAEEAEAAAQLASLEAARERVSSLSASKQRTSSQLLQGEQLLAALEAEASELEQSHPPLVAALQRSREQLIATEKRVVTLQARNDTLGDELFLQLSDLYSKQATKDALQAALFATRDALAEARRLRRTQFVDVDAARKELAENEALTAALRDEMEALKTEAPALFARRAAAQRELDEALSAAERFESGVMAQALALPPLEGAAKDTKPTGARTPAPAPAPAPAPIPKGATVGGPSADVGATLDEKLALTSKRLESTAEEVAGRVQLQMQFAGTVTDAMEAAAAQRDSAQRALEVLAAEQRRASEEMRVTLDTAVSAMEAMQAQWDAAVEANAAELRALREDAARAAEAQNAQGSKLVELKGAFEAEVIAMDTLTKKRRGLAAEEEALRRRYVQLRERRLAKQAGKPPPLPVSLDVDDVAEAVGANVEKAAVAFFRLFGKEKEGNPQLPPGKDDF
ncbi:hypothetical protein Ctob_011625 [Chrysochromulina tobinii]|uniref:Uncharacterized protein n=1 Tax=Chrysochromulina tobinii TaxID=1460289 RepID=A0A0M0J914_9EUKA|nr:hypothetical protein Ctob_011625 [Chrysochromulina tobinii]|eukprot:KOO22728.1 hypothetical protein Ctob_011625 [Chrysochromulina sp. CCMP291]